jgi:hypothetical protein
MILTIVYEHELTTPDFAGYGLYGERWGRYKRMIRLRFDESSTLTPTQHEMVREMAKSEYNNILLPDFINPIPEAKAIELAYQLWLEWKTEHTEGEAK